MAKLAAAKKVSPQLPLAAPSGADQRAIAEANTRVASRQTRLTTALETNSAGAIVNIGPEHSDREGWLVRLDDLFGSRGRNFALSQLNQLLHAARTADGKYDKVKVNGLIAAVEGARPANEIQALLVMQMIVTHELAMQSTFRAMRVDQIPQYDSAGNMAVKLLRTFTMQVEALGKLQRGGEQVVKVVHVHPGGQAIVGNVVGGASGALQGGRGSQ